MSITQSQLDALLDINKHLINLYPELAGYKLQGLLDSWQNDICLKELSKGAIQLSISNYKGTETHAVLATPFLDGAFAYHKSPFAECKGLYTITHVASGLAVATGKRGGVKEAIGFLIKNLPHAAIPFLQTADKDMINTLRGMGDEGEAIITILRDATNIIKGC